MNIKRRLNQILFAAIAAVSVSIGFWYSQSSPQAPSPNIPNNLEATVFPEPRELVPFKLIDQDGKDFTPDSLRQKWSLLFFGFTHCPDVCPTTLKVLQELWRGLPDQTRNMTQIAFVTVDPNRDTVPIIKEYVQYFEPSFLGVTGNLGHITAFTRSLGILYEYVSKGEGKNNYGVNHSSQIVLIDPQSRLRAMFPPPHEADEMRKNFQAIVDFYKE